MTDSRHRAFARPGAVWCLPFDVIYWHRSQGLARCPSPKALSAYVLSIKSPSSRLTLNGNWCRTGAGVGVCVDFVFRCSHTGRQPAKWIEIPKHIPHREPEGLSWVVCRQLSCAAPEIRTLLDIDADRLTPVEVIKVILRAPVDLLWNG